MEIQGPILLPSSGYGPGRRPRRSSGGAVNLDIELELLTIFEAPGAAMRRVDAGVPGHAVANVPASMPEDTEVLTLTACGLPMPDGWEASLPHRQSNLSR
jgi:hypothetical protein